MPEPAYVTIAGMYAERIRSGELPPGTRLPSLAEIVERHGVSDIVARKAYEQLRAQGLVQSVPRRGIFVADQPSSESAPKHSVSVAAAVIDAEGRALVVRRHDNGTWEPPGGVLELEETIHEGLIREVLEKTGLVVEPEFVSGLYKNMKRGILAVVFRCHVVSGELRLSGEMTDFRWLRPEEVPAYTSQVLGARVLDAYRSDGPQVRGYDDVNLL
jgi:8-oxo-dGTP diphosphatase